MCGIAGLLRTTPQGCAADRPTASMMIKNLAHRGPDALDCWAEQDGSIGLGHARLAIRDLSPTGAQPMVSRDGRYVIVYNGEVYSQHELQTRLRRVGKALRGTSDTEAMLESIAAFGLLETCEMLIGMFAFAVWDRERGELSIVRDRMGVKPVYWMQQNGQFAFASELKAFQALPGWAPSLDRDALASFLRFNYVPSPRTIYRDIHKLEPGHILTVRANGSFEKNEYWSLRAAAAEGIRKRQQAIGSPTVADVEVLLSDSVSRRLVSDVPIASLLSGGIDSSLVTALMAERSSSSIRTYSIGFSEASFDEAPQARAIARHLGTAHTELYAEPDHAIALVESLPRIYDEPFSDSSQLPSIMVSELTRQHVPVALTGDGGDEVFGGYNRYLVGPAFGRRLHSMPHAARILLATAARHAPDSLLESVARLLPPRLRRPQAATKFRELAGQLAGTDDNGFYRGLVTHWPMPNNLVLGGCEVLTPLDDTSLSADFPDDLDRMQLLDMMTYLPDDILVKMDRASMSVGLEARVPLLDHRLVEMSWRLPQDMKIRDGVSKWVLREVLAKRVPRELWERPKMGFGIPLDTWLRGPLRSWAEDLLSEERLRSQGLLDPTPIRRKWAAHKHGENWAYPLWDVLMLQAWLDEWQPSLG